MQVGKYTNISRLVLPYESMWGIISKFRLLNRIAPFHIKQIFKTLSGDTLDSNVSLYHLGLTKWNYSNSLTYRSDLVASLTSISIDQLFNHQITSAIDIKDLQWLSVCSHLRFCPSCLASGYHSIFHQMTFFEECPIHNEKLRTKCSYCNANFVYELIDAPVTPFVCPKCNRSIWSRYNQKGGALVEQLLRINLDQRSGLNELFEWLSTFRACPLIRQRFSEALFENGQDVPRITVREVYSVWHDTQSGRDIPAYATPLSVTMRHHTIKFGAHTSGKEQLFCMAYKLGRYSKALRFGGRWVESKAQDCEDGSIMLGPIYKSINRHEFKMLLHRGISCRIPGYASHSIRIPGRCRQCAWAKAYALWREYWSSRLSDPTYCWLDISLQLQDVMNPRVSKWAALWLFSLQCLWELRQAIYLIEQQGDRRAQTESNLQGDLSFTWILEDSPVDRKPIFHFWTKGLSYNQKFACRESKGN